MGDFLYSFTQSPPRSKERKEVVASLPLCFPVKDYFWGQNENSSLTIGRKKRRSLLCEWSRPASFLLKQNIFLTQFNIQTHLEPV